MSLSSRIFWRGLAFFLVFCHANASAEQRQPVDLRLGADQRIRALITPESPRLPLKSAQARPKAQRQKITPPAPHRLASKSHKGQPLTSDTVYAQTINAPPIDGFVPWIIVSFTDKRIPASSLDSTAMPTNSIMGNYLSAQPDTNYAVGIFDSGAGAHVIARGAAETTGIIAKNLLTSNFIEITGVTGSATAYCSKPLAIYIDGLGCINSSDKISSFAGFVGEYNTSVAVGTSQNPALPTAIGSPVSAFFAAYIQNDNPITITPGASSYTAPSITFYDFDDPELPELDNFIPLELRPLGTVNASYFYDPLDLGNYDPSTPTVLMGISSQSLFFISSVDVYEGIHTAIDKTRFMLDTGAQVSVIGSRIAARLALNPNNSDFEVEIEGVSGETITRPGFYIDRLDIPALGDWLSFTQIPVVWLDVQSPEGGTVDGIIGMNLFNTCNFVLHGGGYVGEGDPFISYQILPSQPGDITADGAVNLADLAAFTASWLCTPGELDYNSAADLAPDNKINLSDLSIMSAHWLEVLQ